MTDLRVESGAIRAVMKELDEAMSELLTAMWSQVEVDHRAFGSSPRGSRTNDQVQRAYALIQDTLYELQSTHSDFSDKLAEVERKIALADQQYVADNQRLVTKMDDGTVPA